MLSTGVQGGCGACPVSCATVSLEILKAKCCGCCRHTADADVAIVEGVMGLFDSRDGASEDGSTAQVSKHTPLHQSERRLHGFLLGVRHHPRICARVCVCVCVLVLPADSQVAGCTSCAGAGLLGHGTQCCRNCERHGGV